MSKNIKKNYYERLDLSPKASSKEIKKAYRALAKIHHPDKGGDEDEFKEIQEAYDILIDPETRKMYDDGGDPTQFVGAKARAVDRLCQVMENVIGKVGFMADLTDVIVRMREEINETNLKMQHDIEKNRADIKKYKTIKKRLKKADFLATYVSETIEYLEDREILINKDVDCHNLMLELISDSKYEVDDENPTDMEWVPKGIMWLER